MTDTDTDTDTDTAAAAELTRLGEAYFFTQHRYDPFNATLLGVDEFDGLSCDPSREASERTAQELAAIGRQVREIDTAGLTGAQRVDHGVLTALVEGAAPMPSTRCGQPTRRRRAMSAGRA